MMPIPIGVLGIADLLMYLERRDAAYRLESDGVSPSLR